MRRLFALALLFVAAAPCAAQTPAGRLAPFVIYDSAYQRARQVWVYTPPGYTAHPATPYPLIVAFDGDEYRDTMPLPAVLDTLLAARKAPPVIALLIDDSVSAVRIADLGNASKMVRFLGQVVPLGAGGEVPASALCRHAVMGPRPYGVASA